MPQTAVSTEKSSFSQKKIVRRIFQVFLVLVLLVGVAGFLTYPLFFTGKILPGVYVGSLPLGGLSLDGARQAMESYNNRLAQEGVALQLTDQAGKNISLSLRSELVVNDNFIVSVDAAQTAQVALNFGKEGSFLQNSFQAWGFLWRPVHLPASLLMDDEALSNIIKNRLQEFTDPGHNASFHIEKITPLEYVLRSEQAGIIFDAREVVESIKKTLSNLEMRPIKVVAHRFLPTVTQADLASVEADLPKIVERGDVALELPGHVGAETASSWFISPLVYGDWIEIQKKDSGASLGLNREKVLAYLQASVAPLVEIIAQNPVFSIENNRAQEFRSGHPGQILDGEQTYERLNTLFQTITVSSSSTSVPVALIITEPAVKTGEINNLGISDVVGVGSSSFKGSPVNRIKNITRAVNRLNGVLIAPGEEFSTNKFAGPYTPENGFLPELVIKGNEIKAEVGGGMCQIGTTLFRMAMNSGMPITERHNHSLVVGYYSDPVNGNPGTDATLYDPLLDFKFKNDTGNYLLLETAINTKTQILTFTLWGKADGRSGSFTHPIVKKWLPVGKTQNTFTDTLKPGQQKCQHAYMGAQTTFTYSRITSQGEKIDQIFDSYYRSLPQICLVGQVPTAAPVTNGPCRPGEVCTIIEPQPDGTSVKAPAASTDVP